MSESPTIDEILAGDAQALKKVKARLGLSLDGVARRLGVSKPYASQLINGRRSLLGCATERYIALFDQMGRADAEEMRRLVAIRDAVSAQFVADHVRAIRALQDQLATVRSGLRAMMGDGS